MINRVSTSIVLSGGAEKKNNKRKLGNSSSVSEAVGPKKSKQSGIISKEGFKLYL